MLCLLSIDPALGRLDYDSLSDQTLMEMLVDRFECRMLRDENGCYKDVCEWCIVSCENDRVVSIVFQRWFFDEKQFEFRFLPPLIKNLHASSCDLHGSLNTLILPRGFEYLDVPLNSLSGTLDWIEFPRKLESIYITYNNFAGSVVLSDLPKTLDSFQARGNFFSGSLVFRSLPPSLCTIDLSDNELTGSITIDEMHSSISDINLDANSFSGDFRLLVTPPRLLTVSIMENKGMSGTAVLPKSLNSNFFRLRYMFDVINAVRDEEGLKHQWEEKILDANDDPKKDGDKH